MGWKVEHMRRPRKSKIRGDAHRGGRVGCRNKKLQTLLEDFHGRPARAYESHNVERWLPDTLELCGQVVTINYDSDKRDPGDPHGEGAQGHMKQFTHASGFGVGLYLPPNSRVRAGRPRSEHRVTWPTDVAYLGSLASIELRSGDLLRPQGYDLFVWDDRSTLMCMNRRKKDVMCIWGGIQRVTWRGIEH